MTNVVLCASVRTAIVAYDGGLKDIPAPEMGAGLVSQVLARTGVHPDAIDAVAMGQVAQADAKMNPGRRRRRSGIALLLDTID